VTEKKLIVTISFYGNIVIVKILDEYRNSILVLENFTIIISVLNHFNKSFPTRNRLHAFDNVWTVTMQRILCYQIALYLKIVSDYNTCGNAFTLLHNCSNLIRVM